MDGILAISGYVTVRQVYYSGTQHTVEIQGEGESGILARASVVSQTGEFKNISLLNLAQSVASPFGIGVLPMGSLSPVPFPRVSVQQGESAMEVIEKHARARNAKIAETTGGSLILAGPGAISAVAVVIEGVNIIEGREVIQSLVAGGGKHANLNTGQVPGSDEKHGAPANQMHDNGQGGAGGGGGENFSLPYLPKHGLLEIPGWQQSALQMRSASEHNVTDMDSIKVTVTTLGWQRNASAPPAGGLWKPFDQVYVHSPMLIMDRSLMLRAVTFTQDNQTGTRSTIELVNKTADGGYSDMGQAAHDATGGGQIQSPA